MEIVFYQVDAVNNVTMGYTVNAIVLVMPALFVCIVIYIIALDYFRSEQSEETKKSFDDFVRERHNSFFEFMQRRDLELEEFYANTKN